MKWLYEIKQKTMLLINFVLVFFHWLLNVLTDRYLICYSCYIHEKIIPILI